MITGDPSSEAPSLLDILNNIVIFDCLIPYLSLQTISRLSRTSHAWQEFIFHTPHVFRYLDLSRCRGAYISPSLISIDSGGNSWRAERMDENLTEDEFYSGPLRGVLSKLRQKKVLHGVQVLVLDGLLSVTNDIVAEIATQPGFNVRLLSIRKCANVNQSKLQQLLRYICRPARPTASPRLQGLYYFTDPAADVLSSKRETGHIGVMTSDGATLGVLPTDKNRCDTQTFSSWYAPSGQIIQHGANTRSTWEETLQVCRGIIAFDTVLCSHMHQAMADCLHDGSRDILVSKPGIPTIATVALGPEGCSGCGRAPAGAPVWGESDLLEFPLLAPPPHSGRAVDAVRPPPLMVPSIDKSVPQRLIASCTWCLTNRHCDNCHRWWCTDCYNPRRSSRLLDLEPLTANPEVNYSHVQTGMAGGQSQSSSVGDSVKVFNGLCIQNCLVGEMMSGAGSMGMWA